MFKKVCTLFLAVTMLFVSAVPALAADNNAQEAASATKPLITVENLLDIAKTPEDESLSRGAFAAMLVYAADIPTSEIDESENLPSDLDAGAWYAGAVKALWDRNILNGFAGNAYPERPITGMEALALTARMLGIPEDVISEGSGNSSDEESVDYELYSWIIDQNFTQKNINSTDELKAGDAASLLVNVFGIDEDAKSIIDMANEKSKDIKSFRADGDMQIRMDMSAGDTSMEGLEVASTLNMEYTKDAYHQKMTQTIKGLEESIDLEQYIDKDYIYTLTDTGEGEAEWTKMKNFMPMLFDEDFLTQQQDWAKDIEDIASYKLLGKVTIDGKEYYKVATYSRLEDLSKIFSAIPGFSEEEIPGLEEAENIVKFIAVRGINYVSVEDGLTSKAKASATALFNEDAQKDSPLAVKALEMSMNYNYHDYNADIEIEIPDEAKNAEEVNLEELPEEAPQE
ncbi:MAG TPA: hypothetical protein GXX43_03510 [Tepidanaerobacter syntrophicus]|uniref:DUF6612 family protein n=1 Tax=Tepidanaerobacter syntrophicus TaxID=224999 RepID=UPI0017631AE8|nr:DUF6612 family protein [Tepidanaerobacter syntrophicus]HHV82718.1 hypothetical protein [Tepidanaerobacter syntrophicus]